MIPRPLASVVQHALAAYLDSPQTLRDAQPLGGGCISNATRVRTEGGAVAFLKWATRADAGAGMFACEAHGLEAMRATGTVRVPRVIGWTDSADDDYRWILLEYIEPGTVTREGWQRLGRELAALHRKQQPSFGWNEPNFIGSLPQSNDVTASWPAFWRDRRLAKQLDRARGILGGANAKRIEQLLHEIDDLASAGDQEGASLLHGDLWGGNVHGTAEGTAALIDPSCYYGHREVDLAMAKLFGGFSEVFFEAYREAWSLLPGHEQRVRLYQLYYMLVHVNLFGASYASGTMSLVSSLGF